MGTITKTTTQTIAKNTKNTQDMANSCKILLHKSSGHQIPELTDVKYTEVISPLGRYYYELIIGQTFDMVKYIDYLHVTLKAKIAYSRSSNPEYKYVLEVCDQ